MFSLPLPILANPYIPMDMVKRLINNLVPWFGIISPSTTPNLYALLVGCGETDRYIYDLIQDANLQTRISSATGFYLDYIFQDYYATTNMNSVVGTIEVNNVFEITDQIVYLLPRYLGENDDSFRARIQAGLLEERATRNGMSKVLTNLTGRVPIIIEGWNIETSAYFDNTFYFDQFGGMGFTQPYTCIIFAYRPQGGGLYEIGGFDSVNNSNYFGGFGFDANFNNALFDPNQEIIFVRDQDIVNAVQNTKVWGTFVYLYILN